MGACSGRWLFLAFGIHTIVPPCVTNDHLVKYRTFSWKYRTNKQHIKKEKRGGGGVGRVFFQLLCTERVNDSKSFTVCGSRELLFKGGCSVLLKGNYLNS